MKKEEETNAEVNINETPLMVSKRKYTRLKKKLSENQPQSSSTQNIQENVTEESIDNSFKTAHQNQSEMGPNVTTTNENKKSIESYIPDGAGDMNFDREVWREFLSTFSKPLDDITKTTEDDEQDPEYNVSSDEEVDEVERQEELRADRAVTISRKELNTLKAELVEFTDMYDSNKLEETSMKANEENTVEAAPVTIQIAPLTTEDSTSECENASVTEQHVLLLTQQIRQHIQMCTQNFLLSYEHPEFSDLAPSFKSMLTEFKRGAEGKVVSFFNAANLNSAIKLVKDWEHLFLTQSPEAVECKQHFARNLVESLQAEKSMFYQETIPDPLMDVVAKSDAFLYPHLLPPVPFKSNKLCKKLKYHFDSEDSVIALFLEKAIPYLEQNTKNMSPGIKREQYEVVARHIQELFMPNVKVSAIVKNILKKQEPAASRNPIQFYFRHNRAPPTTHFVEQFDCNNIVPLYKRNLDLFSVQWREFIYTKYHHVPMELTEKIVTLISHHYINTPQITTNSPVIIISSPIEAVPVSHNYHELALIDDASLNDQSFQLVHRTRRKTQNVPKDNQKKRTDLYNHHSNRQVRESLLFPSGKLKNTQNNDKPHQEYSTVADKKYSRNLVIEKNDSESNSYDLSEFLSFPSRKLENAQNRNEDPLVECSTVANKKSDSNSVIQETQQKLRKLLISLITHAGEPQTQQQKEESELFQKLRGSLTPDDYDKLKDILREYDTNGLDFLDMLAKVQTLLFPKYRDLKEKLSLFLTEIQARETGPLMSYFIMQDMDLFRRSLKTYLDNKPADFKRIVNCLNDFVKNRKTIEDVKSLVVAIIKQNEKLTEWFLTLLPSKKPVIDNRSSQVSAKSKSGENKTRKRKDPDEFRPLKKSAKRVKSGRKVCNRDESDSSSSPSKSITNLSEHEESTIEKLDVSNENKQMEVVEVIRSERADELPEHITSTDFSLHLESEPESVKLNKLLKPHWTPYKNRRNIDKKKEPITPNALIKYQQKAPSITRNIQMTGNLRNILHSCNINLELLPMQMRQFIYSKLRHAFVKLIDNEYISNSNNTNDADIVQLFTFPMLSLPPTEMQIPSVSGNDGKIREIQDNDSCAPNILPKIEIESPKLASPIANKDFFSVENEIETGNSENGTNVYDVFVKVEPDSSDSEADVDMKDLSDFVVTKIETYENSLEDVIKFEEDHIKCEIQEFDLGDMK